MIPKIKNIIPIKNYRLQVKFDDGKEVVYDVKKDIEQIPCFAKLINDTELFDRVQLDQSRTCQKSRNKMRPLDISDSTWEQREQYIKETFKCRADGDKLTGSGHSVWYVYRILFINIPVWAGNA